MTGEPWSPARAEAYLRSLELFGMRFGLDRMHHRLELPEAEMPGDEEHAHTTLDQNKLDDVVRATEWYALFPHCLHEGREVSAP